MTPLKTLAVALAVAALAGCSSAPPMRVEPVEVSGVVLAANGQPIKDVTIQFLATSAEQQSGAATIKGDGKFTSKLTPGKYTFALEGKNAPAAYTSNSPDHNFEVPSGGTSALQIVLK